MIASTESYNIGRASYNEALRALFFPDPQLDPNTSASNYTDGTLFVECRSACIYSVLADVTSIVEIQTKVATQFFSVVLMEVGHAHHAVREFSVQRNVVFNTTRASSTFSNFAGIFSILIHALAMFLKA